MTAENDGPRPAKKNNTRRVSVRRWTLLEVSPGFIIVHLYVPPFAITLLAATCYRPGNVQHTTCFFMFTRKPFSHWRFVACCDSAGKRKGLRVCSM